MKPASTACYPRILKKQRSISISHRFDSQGTAFHWTLPRESRNRISRRMKSRARDWRNKTSTFGIACLPRMIAPKLSGCLAVPSSLKPPASCLLRGKNPGTVPGSLYIPFLTTEQMEHTEAKPCAVMPFFRGFGVFGGSLFLATRTPSRFATRSQKRGYSVPGYSVTWRTWGLYPNAPGAVVPSPAGMPDGSKPL